MGRRRNRAESVPGYKGGSYLVCLSCFVYTPTFHLARCTHNHLRPTARLLRTVHKPLPRLSRQRPPHHNRSHRPRLVLQRAPLPLTAHAHRRLPHPPHAPRRQTRTAARRVPRPHSHVLCAHHRGHRALWVRDICRVSALHRCGVVLPRSGVCPGEWPGLAGCRRRGDGF